MSHLVIPEKSSTEEGEIADGRDTALPAEASAVVKQYRRQARRKILAILALSIAAFAAFAIATIVGPIDLSLMELWKALIDPNGVDETTHTVLWNLRLPASVMAVLIGASLSLSGAHMQTILDNPLAEPFTLGISAAAAFGGAASIVLGLSLIHI